MQTVKLQRSEVYIGTDNVKKGLKTSSAEIRKCLKSISIAACYVLKESVGTGIVIVFQ